VQSFGRANRQVTCVAWNTRNPFQVRRRTIAVDLLGAGASIIHSSPLILGLRLSYHVWTVQIAVGMERGRSEPGIYIYDVNSAETERSMRSATSSFGRVVSDNRTGTNVRALLNAATNEGLAGMAWKPNQPSVLVYGTVGHATDKGHRRALCLLPGYPVRI
jgi:hypothetical protein